MTQRNLLKLMYITNDLMLAKIARNKVLIEYGLSRGSWQRRKAAST